MNDLVNNIKKLELEFLKLIHHRFGLVIHVYQAKDIMKIIHAKCCSLTLEPQEYLEQLKKCTPNSPLLADFVAAITVGESYFFRDKNQINLIEKTILPALINKNTPHSSLKIWSAGCSTGEEIYTIAMLLHELLPNTQVGTLDLIGTDINATALDKASTGIYGQWSMRSISEKYIQRYFTKKNRTFILSPEIRNMVRFKYLNLCDNGYPSIINGIHEVDLILCRNVLIYFDNDLVVKIMKKLSYCMTEHSYLLLGASDPIITNGSNLVFHHHGAIYFTLENTIKNKWELREL